MILAIDPALAATSACILVPGETEPVAFESLPMQGGHAEALFPLLDRVVSRSPGGFDAITRVAVTVGPGSFTGIRIGVAAGRAIGGGTMRLVGSGGPLLAVAAGGLGINAEVDEASFTLDVAFVARLGGLADPSRALPRPLYLKAPDATPPKAVSLLRSPG